MNLGQNNRGQYRQALVEGQGNSPLAEQTLNEHQVATGVLGGAEDGLGHGAGGVVHRDEQRQLGPRSSSRGC